MYMYLLAFRALTKVLFDLVPMSFGSALADYVQDLFEQLRLRKLWKDVWFMDPVFAKSELPPLSE